MQEKEDELILGYVCSPDDAEVVAMLFSAIKAVDCGIKGRNVSEIARIAVRSHCTRFIVIDYYLDDSEVYSLARIFVDGRKEGKKTPDFCFVGDAWREPQSELYSKLINLGINNVVGPRFIDDEGYNKMTNVSRMVTHNMTKRDAMPFLLSPAEERLLEREEIKKKARAYKDKFSLVQAADNETRTVLVFQDADRSGSTHTAIAIARALRSMNARVALILPQKHFDTINRLHKGKVNSINGEEGGIALYGMGIYPGNSIAFPYASRYDYVVFDQGTPSWYKTANERGEAALSIDERLEKMNFDAARSIIWCAEVSPTGDFQLVMRGPDGKTPLSKFPTKTKLFAKVRFSIYGVNEDYAFAAMVSKIATYGNPAGVICMPPVLNPFTSSASVEDIPEGVLDLLMTNIIPNKISNKLKEIINKETEESIDSTIDDKESSDTADTEDAKPPKRGFIGKLFSR